MHMLEDDKPRDAEQAVPPPTAEDIRIAVENHGLMKGGIWRMLHASIQGDVYAQVGSPAGQTAVAVSDERRACLLINNDTHTITEVSWTPPPMPILARRQEVTEEVVAVTREAIIEDNNLEAVLDTAAALNAAERRADAAHAQANRLRQDVHAARRRAEQAEESASAAEARANTLQDRLNSTSEAQRLYRLNMARAFLAGAVVALSGRLFYDKVIAPDNQAAKTAKADQPLPRSGNSRPPRFDIDGDSLPEPAGRGNTGAKPPEKAPLTMNAKVEFKDGLTWEALDRMGIVRGDNNLSLYLRDGRMICGLSIHENAKIVIYRDGEDILVSEEIDSSTLVLAESHRISLKGGFLESISTRGYPTKPMSPAPEPRFTSKDLLELRWLKPTLCVRYNTIPSIRYHDITPEEVSWSGVQIKSEPGRLLIRHRAADLPSISSVSDAGILVSDEKGSRFSVQAVSRMANGVTDWEMCIFDHAPGKAHVRIFVRRTVQELASRSHPAPPKKPPAHHFDDVRPGGLWIDPPSDH
jgi:hypothetical protein